MLRSAWLRRTGPGVVALLAVGMLTSTTLGARDHPWVPPACPAPTDVGEPSLHADARAAITLRADRPWFRSDPMLDANGALAGQRLVIGRLDGLGRRMLDQARESFAAGPFGRIVLSGSDDGSGSRLLALDVVAGCATIVDESKDVIRRATISPDGRSVVESRVDRRTRADLGIWHKPLGPEGRATRLLPAIEPDARFGPTWSTDLVWSPDGTQLAIQSCGEAACRTRILTPETGGLSLVDGPDLGPAVGLADGQLVAYLACVGLPCPVVAIDVASGARHTLASEAGPAVLIATTDGPRVIHQRPTDAGWKVSSVGLDGQTERDLGDVPSGFGLLRDGMWSDAGLSIPAGWFALAPDGRLPLDASGPAPVLRNALDGRSSALQEILP